MQIQKSKRGVLQSGFLTLLFLVLLHGCSTQVDEGLAKTDSDEQEDVLDSSVGVADTADDVAGEGQSGCGKAALHTPGGVNVTIDVGPGGNGERTFFLSLPQSYDPQTPHKLIVGYAGTNWLGEEIQPYLNLETDQTTDEIFVYPDPLWRDFPGWGTLGGWVLGPWAEPANGDQDLIFSEAILDYMTEHYCIDTQRVFATGHSWGGDMAQVVSCFLGERFRASVPVAANRPYWFEKPGGSFVDCTGTTAVWTMFGEGDTHFSNQRFAGEFGDQCRDFWLNERTCDGSHAYTDLGFGALDECVEFAGCSASTRYCLYSAQSDHQVPDYYSAATMGFFRSF